MAETRPRHLLILGSTGSIGRQALEVLASVPGCELVGLAAGSSVDLLLEQAALHGVKVVCLRDAKAAKEAAALLLTGSGGPFRGRTAAELAAVTPEEALKHPTWSMGPKISIDSATLMNKGLEVIEAHYLFGVPYERITV